MTDYYQENTLAMRQDQIQEMLDVVRLESNATGLFLVDESGFLISDSGDLGVDKIALAALISASFAATEEIASLVEEKNFNRLTQQGKNLNLFICKAGKRHIIITVFGRETNLGLIKLYVERAAALLADILDTPQAVEPATEIDTISKVPDEAPDSKPQMDSTAIYRTYWNKTCINRFMIN